MDSDVVFIDHVSSAVIDTDSSARSHPDAEVVYTCGKSSGYPGRDECTLRLDDAARPGVPAEPWGTGPWHRAQALPLRSNVTVQESGPSNIKQEFDLKELPGPQHPSHYLPMIPNKTVSQAAPLPPPPPPPPPPPGTSPFYNAQGIPTPHPPPPPPPPPPAALPVPTFNVMNVEEEVSRPTSFLPVRYSGESALDDASRMIRIAPFRRNVLITRHQAHPADFEEHRWILKYGSPEKWYERPTRSALMNLRYHVSPRCPTEPLGALSNARPVSLENPRVWASAALVTPTDDDIYDCTSGHAATGDLSGICGTCTEEKSEALESTPLVYYIVLSTCQASDPFVHGAHFNGKQIYKLVKCGSREAAVAETFYSAGVNGWNVAFSCVMRLGEDFDERCGDVVKTDDLWQLGEETSDEDIVRAFY